ncbi:MAG: GNAT family N-acetyltransferase [Melioribacteraceae bacterium]
MKLKKANISDSEELTDLTKKSKAFWGYTAEQIEEWSEELTITKSFIEENQVVKLIVEQKIVGFYSYYNIDDDKIKLEHLFIHPKNIGEGYGRYLMNDFLKKVEDIKAKKVTLDADPNAEDFYKKFNFKVVGKLKSTIKNRFLPIMEKEL